MPPRVSVVIPNWNGREYLDMMLPSLRHQTFSDFETIVVDNGSEDGSVGYLREAWPQVRVISLEDNRGFAGGVNRGIDAARGELIALVNNDLELDASWLAELVRELDSRPAAASATGKILDFGDRRTINAAGDIMSWYGATAPRGVFEADEGQYDQPGPVFSACAGAAVYRAEAFSDVGLFDEDFFAYFEDVDWGFRAQLRGHGCRYVPTAVAYHLGAGTSSRIRDFSFRLERRNEIAVVVKNFPGRALARHAPRLFVYAAVQLASAVRARRTKVLLEAWIGALRDLPRTLEKRRTVQTRRRVPLGHLEGVISSRYPFPRPESLHVLDRVLFRSPITRSEPDPPERANAGSWDAAETGAATPSPPEGPEANSSAPTAAP